MRVGGVAHAAGWAVGQGVVEGAECAGPALDAGVLVVIIFFFIIIFIIIIIIIIIANFIIIVVVIIITIIIITTTTIIVTPIGHVRRSSLVFSCT